MAQTKPSDPVPPAAGQAPTAQDTRREGRRSPGLFRSDLAMSIFWIAFFVIAALRSHRPFAFTSLLDHPNAAKTALLLTAHPDDEAMFFTPTLTSLLSQGWEIRALCFSTGNGDGLGAERSKELYDSYEVLGVPRKNVALMVDERFQDGMDNHWNISQATSVLDGYVLDHAVSLIITFDQNGITQHPNHIALHEAVASYTTQTISSVQTLYLRSPSVYTKFTGGLYPSAHIFSRNLLNPWESGKRALGLAGPPTRPSSVVVVGSLWNWITGWKAMLRHKTQLVWFRWLYLAFSRLMWMNELILAVP